MHRNFGWVYESFGTPPLGTPVCTVFPRIEAPASTIITSDPWPVFEARSVFKARRVLEHPHYDELTVTLCISQKQYARLLKGLW